MTSAIREIDTGALPDRYARGWRCLGTVKDFSDGKPHAVNAFGTRLVVFADSKGELHVLDGYCRHMGGDLSQGAIKGDEVACPFHDWRWGGDGRCKSVPYAKRTLGWPAPVRGRPTCAAVCFVWHDHEGNAPQPEVRIPEIPEHGSGEWTDWKVEFDAHRGLQLPGDHRQRHRHGPLLLHPFRTADVLQERLRRAHSNAVPAQRRPGPT